MSLLTVVFQQEASPSTHTLPPLSALRMHGSVIRETADGAELAHHENSRWRLHGKTYLRIDCTDLVRIRMEREGRESESFGPFTHFSCSDGVAFAEHLRFAWLDEKAGLWSCSHCAGDWPVLVVTPA